MLLFSRVLFLLKEYISYWLHCVDEHSLHTPHIFDFYKQVVKSSEPKSYPAIEELRKQLLNDHREIAVSDPGAGSSYKTDQKRKISFIARSSSSQLKFSLLLTRLIHQKQPKTILELGTSLGINTLYMSQAAKEAGDDAVVHTIEGSPEIAQLARKQFKSVNADNIILHEGNLDIILAPVLQQLPPIDLAYLDANHTYEATIRYFELIKEQSHQETIIILDDIHWSAGMKKAWHEIINRPDVTSSVDLFDAGIVFLKKGLQKQQLVLRF